MDILTNILLELAILFAAALVSAIVAFLKPRVERLFNTLADKDESGLVAILAEEAVELVEARFIDMGGDEKFEEALAMLERRLERRGLDFDEESLRMKIQRGWRLMDDKQRSKDGLKKEEDDS